MKSKVLSGVSVGLLVMGFARMALATGFTDIGQDIEAKAKTEVELDGALRLRGELLYNLDLDRGTTPSGEMLFPVSLADPTKQMLSHADMRLRTDIGFYLPIASMAVKLRVDVVDNLGLGSAPMGDPATTYSQEPPPVALLVRRAYGEVLLPFGVLAAGRMGSHWGLGMLTNGGDCADCDSGDSSDRIALISPMLGHLWAFAFDFSSSGAFVQRRDARRFIDIEPSDDVRSVTLACMRWRNDDARLRRRKAGKTTVEYGAFVSYRWQENDIPASYLPLATEVELGPTQVMARGLKAVAADAWFRLSLPKFRLEAEAALLWAHIDQPSLIPGVLLPDAVESLQFGAALETEYGALESRFGFGLDMGFASGDSAPGFGAFPGLDDPAPQAHDLDGAQASPPYDNRADNFRFHPDYRIDRILFREIIGTVTDTFYLRPHLKYRLLDLGRGHLTAALAGVASWAVRSESTPGGHHPLGIEIDPTLAYVNDLGFAVVFEYAVLFPLSGLDNPDLGLSAKPAQLAHLRLIYGF